MFARATYGLKTDSMFATHIANAKKAKIVTGAYHFMYGSSVASPEAQADAFMKVALARKADIWALDYEPSQAPATKSEAKRFIARVHKAGYKIGLYASRSGFPFDLGQDFDWIADWDATVFPRHAEFWQYRGSPIDLDKFDGTYEELRALAAIPPITENDVRFVNSDSFNATSGKRLPVKAGRAWKYLDGSAGGTFGGDTEVEVFGTSDAHAGQYVVEINTGNPYSDKAPRRTLVLVEADAAELIDAPSSAATIQELNAQIAALNAQIANIPNLIAADRAKAQVKVVYE